MGVEYTSKFGIGLKIVSVNGISVDSEIEDEFTDALDKTEIEYIQIGNYLSGNKPIEFFAIIDNPFEWGFDLSAKISTLKELLAANNIVTEGEMDLVGGLRIW